jgi:hypothetical protein
MTSILDLLIGFIVAIIGYWVKTTSDEQKRIQILLNKTREEYATKFELRDDMTRVMEALHRVEDKLDKVLSK